jgi:hypothetical protein
MGRRRESVRSVSLFPFLAVLVCAMGALILLLLVTTRRIRRDAEQRAEAEIAVTRIVSRETLAPPVLQPPAIEEVIPAPIATPPPTEPALPEPPAIPSGPTPAEFQEARRREHEQRQFALEREWNAKVADLTARLDSSVQSLEALREQQQSRQSQQADLAAQLAAVETRRASAAASRQETREKMRALTATRQDLDEEIDAVAARLTQLHAQQNAQPNDVFTIVPVDRLSGTTRRPIVIECLADRINFAGEGIALTAADLDGFIPQYNPLAAGVKALGGAWHARDGEDPYVLLIVRPQGTVSFYIARMFLTASRVPFGYELVAEDRKLTWPKTDPEIVSQCRAAIDATLSRRDRIPEMASMAGPDAEIVHVRGSDGGFHLKEIEELREPPERTVHFGNQRLDRDEYMAGGGEIGRGSDGGKAEDQRRFGLLSRSSETRREPEGGRTGGGSSGSLPVHPLPHGAGAPRPIGGTSNGSSRRGEERTWMSPLSTGIAVQRDITIQIEKERVTVEDESPIGINPRTSGNELAEATIDRVDEVIGGWRPAPQGFYWKPRMRFVVSPGCVQRYAELDRAMKAWGIDTTVEYLRE